MNFLECTCDDYGRASVAFAEEAGSGWLAEWAWISLVASIKAALRFVRKQAPSDAVTCSERVGQ
jgi:hypothetical protein